MPPLHRLRLMPLGGSVTAGVGSSHGNGYRPELVRLLNQRSFEVQVVGSRNTGRAEITCHEGWRGFRLDAIQKKAQRWVEEFQPNLFAVNAGSNDCLQDYQLGGIADRMQSLLAFLWKSCPGSVVALSTLIVNRDPEVDGRIQAVNQVYRELVARMADEKRRIVLADMYSPEGPSLDDLTDDGIHPGDEGYNKMARIWARAIEGARDQGLFGQS